MKRILVVDDEPSITTLLKYNLEKENFEVDVCFDGEEAIHKATTNQYDFMILDLMLPKVNGFDVTKQLRKEKKLPAFPKTQIPPYPSHSRPNTFKSNQML